MIRYEKMAIPAIMAESDSFRVLERVASPVVPVRKREDDEPDAEPVGVGAEPDSSGKATGERK